MKRLRRAASLAALCGLAGLGWLGIESSGATIEISPAPLATARAEHVELPRTTALGEHAVSDTDIASGSAALFDYAPMPQPVTPPVQLASVNPTAPVQDAKQAVSSEPVDACPDACIDQYPWSLYERTPKVDTVTVEERIKEKIKKKGKTKTVTKTLTKYVTEDFGWKDEKAARKPACR